MQRKDAFFAVATDSQTSGRGTRGRDWLSPKGNLMLTISLKRSMVPIPITLLPLRVGTIIASCMARRITTNTQVKLKWPNDILIDSKKVPLDEVFTLYTYCKTCRFNFFCISTTFFDL